MLHDARFERLQGLGVFAHDDAAGRHSDDVDLAQHRPQQHDDEERADRPRHAAGRRVGRRFLQAERRREERRLIGKSARASQFMAQCPRRLQNCSVPPEQFDDRMPKRGLEFGAHDASPMAEPVPACIDQRCR